MTNADPRTNVTGEPADDRTATDDHAPTEDLTDTDDADDTSEDPGDSDPTGSTPGDQHVPDKVFDPEHYLPLTGERLGGEHADREAEFLAEVLELDPDDRVLDVPCGHGRHANRLAERGVDVAGLDRSGEFLERARADADDRGVAVEYARGDMRELPWGDDEFDAAYNVFTSFGFFDDEGNRRVLAELARVVRPGGRLVMEMVDRDGMLYDYRPESVSEFEDGYVVETREYDPTTGRNHTDRLVVHEGEVHEHSYAVRTYSYTELSSLLERVGFRVRETYGDLTGGDYSLESGRLCVVARRVTG